MRDIIINLLYKKTKLNKDEIEDLLEKPSNSDLGDYAFPCFTLSKKLKKPPVEIALELSRDLNKRLPKEIDKIANKGGYVNFFLNNEIFFEENLKHALNKDYGSGKQKDKILVEHTSVNPNASPHVGRTRNSIIGDSITRILKFLGNKVEIHYYVNDVSKQIAMLALNFNSKDKFSHMLQKYVEVSKLMEKDPKIEKQVFDLLEKFESGDKKTTQLFNKIVGICVDGQSKVFGNLGINFDKFDYESNYLRQSKKVLEDLDKAGKLSTDKEGRKVLDLSKTPLIKKMRSPFLALTRSNGTGLYPLRDIAYTIDKSKFGRNLIVLGEDQKLYFEQISEAIKMLNHKSPEVVHYSFVLIQESGKAKKMSTRKGELVLLEEFFQEALKKATAGIKKRKTSGNPTKVAIGAIKYAMLKNDNDKNIIFSWDQSLNFEGDSGPYLQYSYARASSIIRKSKIKNQKSSFNNLHENEISLIKKISEFPDIVVKAGEKYNPSIIANYSFQLAQKFNEFYHGCKVIGDTNEARRIKLIESFRNTLKNSLHLLGIEVMEEM